MAVETILATWLILAAAPAAAFDDQAELRIYLPRAQQVRGSTLSLGAVCIVRGSDRARAGRAE